MITPSTSVCGLAIISGMSLQVPGSDSSALTTRYGLRVVLRDEAPLHAGREAGAAPAAQAGVLDLLDDGVGLHAERLLQRAVAAADLVGRERPGAVGVPVVGEDGGQYVRHFCPYPGLVPSPHVVSACRLVGLGLACCAGVDTPPTSAARGRLRAPGRAARPAVLAGDLETHQRGGPGGRPRRRGRRGKPASTRSASRQVTTRGPRVERTSAPRRSSTSWVADSGVMVVHELPVDHHHRRVVAGRVALDVLERDLAVVAVVSSLPTSRWSLSRSKIASPPITAHSVLVQTPTW